jgi:hypothetical protein
MPAISLARGADAIDRVGTAALPKGLRHHGIVANPKTGAPMRRPGRVGDVRFVRIDLSGRRRSDPLDAALDALYEDFERTTRSLHDGLRPIAPRSGGDPDSTPLAMDVILRPLAARLDHASVSIWAEVDAQANALHALGGMHAFGEVVVEEPRITRDAVVTKGDELDDLCEKAQMRLYARHARQATDQAVHRRRRARQTGIVTSILAFITVIATGNVLGSMVGIALVVATLAVLYSTANDGRWATVERWLEATREIGSQPVPTRRSSPSPWPEIHEAIAEHAPGSVATALAARESLERLAPIAQDSVSPHLHARVASLSGGPGDLLEAYRRPARLALPDEARGLAEDLASALAALGQAAEEVRASALAEARSGFDDHRRYVEKAVADRLLSPF